MAKPNQSSFNPPVRQPIDNDGKVLVSRAWLDWFGTLIGDFYSPAPLSASAVGSSGQVAYDASYLYICVAKNTWRRIAHATW